MKVGSLVNVVELQGGGERVVYQCTITRETRTRWHVDGDHAFRKSDGAKVPQYKVGRRFLREVKGD